MFFYECLGGCGNIFYVIFLFIVFALVPLQITVYSVLGLRLAGLLPNDTPLAIWVIALLSVTLALLFTILAYVGPVFLFFGVLCVSIYFIVLIMSSCLSVVSMISFVLS